MNIKKRVSPIEFLRRARPSTALLSLGVLGGLLGLGLLGWQVPAHAGAYETGLRVYQDGNYELAVQYFSQAVQERRDDANAHYYLADSYLKTRRFAEAQAEYQKILVMAPHSQAARMSQVGLASLNGLMSGSGRFKVGRASGLSGTSSAAGKPSTGADRYTGVVPEGEDYLSVITDGGRYVRWSMTKMPLKIYVEPSPQGIRNFQPTFINQIRRAMDVWVGALGNQISYQEVSFPEQADIRVYWKNSIDTRGTSVSDGTAYTAGLTQPRIRNDQLESMEVTMATFGIDGKPQNAKAIYEVAVHELGHAMGLLGHSEDSGDIMYPQNRGIVQPSRRDLKTLLTLYAKPADVSNRPPGKGDPDRQQEIAASLDEQISRQEATLKAHDSALNWMNLGTAYFRKAQVVEKTSAAEASALYDKALKTFTESLKREPNSMHAYQKRSLVYQIGGKLELALQDLDQAIRLDSRNGELYLQQSWLLVNMGQKGRARAALDTYLVLKPSGAGSPDVQRVQEKLAEQ